MVQRERFQAALESQFARCPLVVRHKGMITEHVDERVLLKGSVMLQLDCQGILLPSIQVHLFD
jgi:hypothetical protein